jgi:hypothetical protein
VNNAVISCLDGAEYARIQPQSFDRVLLGSFCFFLFFANIFIYLYFVVILFIMSIFCHFRRAMLGV